MNAVSANEVLHARLSTLKQQQAGLAEQARVFVPETQPILIKPSVSSWADLKKKLEKVINLAGLWVTVRERYEAGQGAELETAAEIALATAKKSPYHLFAAMVSKKSGYWETRTLKVVYEAWEVRRNALMVIDKLRLEAKSAQAILALAWRLKGTIIRLLGIATEQGTGITNPVGLFFALARKPATT
jgi:hypothetical protein